MAVTGTDLFVLNRGGTHYKETIANLQSAIGVTVTDNLTSTATDEALSAAQGKVLNDKVDALGTVEHTAADITARDALSGLIVGDRVYVADASADGTVASGWAIYRLQSTGPNVFTKMAEQESLDVSIVTNLSYTASPTQGVVASDNGTDATVPAVDGTNAGLMLPAHKAKVDFVSVTQAVDLDAIETASHAAATTAGSATTNPIAITAGQEISFDIAALAVAP